MDSVDVPRQICERKFISRVKRRAQPSNSDFSLGMFEHQSTHSDCFIELSATSSCSDSGSDSVLPCRHDRLHQSTCSSIVHASRLIVASKIASQPHAAAAAGSSRMGEDCGLFLDSCNRIHMQCKMVCDQNLVLYCSAFNS